MVCKGRFWAILLVVVTAFSEENSIEVIGLPTKRLSNLNRVVISTNLSVRRSDISSITMGQRMSVVTISGSNSGKPKKAYLVFVIQIMRVNAWLHVLAV